MKRYYTIVLGDSYAGYYGYDANGERVYKLTGISNLGQVNSGSIKAQAIFDDAVLYPNPYIVISQTGYTKHYYASTERLATVIVVGGFVDMDAPRDKPPHLPRIHCALRAGYAHPHLWRYRLLCLHGFPRELCSYAQSAGG